MLKGTLYSKNDRTICPFQQGSSAIELEDSADADIKELLSDARCHGCHTE